MIHVVAPSRPLLIAACLSGTRCGSHWIAKARKKAKRTREGFAPTANIVDCALCILEVDCFRSCPAIRKSQSRKTASEFAGACLPGAVKSDTAARPRATRSGPSHFGVFIFLCLANNWQGIMYLQRSRRIFLKSGGLMRGRGGGGILPSQELALGWQIKGE